MSSHFRLVPVAATRPPDRARGPRLAALTLAALIVRGCTAAPTPFAGPDPADPHVRVPAVTYRSALRDYSSARPSEPKPWIQREGGAAPQPKKDAP
jgi:hypothetical protein